MTNVIDYTAVAILHVTAYLAFTLIIFRSFLRWYRGERFGLEDYLMMSSIVWLAIRLGMVHMVLVWGTNNVPEEIRKQGFTEEDIWRRQQGSKMLLANRFAYNTFLWVMKSCLLLFYKRLTNNVYRYDIILLAIWVIMGLSYVAAQVSTFAECRPFHLYWQVVPPAGGCEKTQLQLFVFGGLNIFTDLLLIIIPMLAFWKTRIPLAKKIQIFLLFCVGFFVVAVTIIRMPYTSKNKSAQSQRTMWSSVELFAACFVANAPAIYSLLRRGREQSSSARSHSNSGYVHGDAPDPAGFFSRKGRNRPEASGTDTFHMARYGLKMPESTSNETLTTNAAATGTGHPQSDGTHPHGSFVVTAATETVLSECHADTTRGSLELDLKPGVETKIWSGNHESV